MATYNGHNEDSSGNILLNIGNGMTATVELGSTASQAYTKGAYLFFNNRLCKASSAISSGATLAIGTNLSQTSLGAELTSHLRASNGDEFYFDYKDGKAGYYPSASKTASQFVPFGGSSDIYCLYNTASTIMGLHAVENGHFISSEWTVTIDGVTFTLVSNGNWKANVAGTWYGNAQGTYPATTTVIHASANQQVTVYFNIVFVKD